MIGGLKEAPALETPAPAPAEGPVTVVEPGARWKVDVRELWDYRGLFWFLVWRDVKVRYAQTVLGAGWAILQPLLTMVVFSVIFGRLAAMPSDGVPYPIFSLTALVPWTYFSTSLSTASNSLVSNTNLLTKVYFPRLVIPMAPVLAGLVDFAIGFLIVIVMLFAYGITPGLEVLALLPLLVGIMVVTAAGVGTWMAALHIQYRDVKYVVPFLVQVWMYLSPIVYPMTLVPERLRPVYALNPMVGVVEGFRNALLGTGSLTWQPMAVSVATSILIFVSGVIYFRRMEHVFADVA